MKYIYHNLPLITTGHRNMTSVGMIDFPKLFLEREAAEYLRCSTDTLCRERKRGLIGYTRVGGRVRYTEEQLIQYLRNQKVGP